jgi:hypothetical protein
MKNIKTTRVNTGIYKIERDGRVFQAERVEDGQWQILELISNDLGLEPNFEYINHFLDLKSCKILVNDYFNEL